MPPIRDGRGKGAAKPVRRRKPQRFLRNVDQESGWRRRKRCRAKLIIALTRNGGLLLWPTPPTKPVAAELVPLTRAASTSKSSPRRHRALIDAAERRGRLTGAFRISL
jgi:hypothetical protein